jgi:AraC-like DNA-binding protein
MNFKLHYVGSEVIEKGDFKIERPEGSPRYLFFHFISSCKITINNKTYDAPPGSCILYEPNVKQIFESDSMRINHDYIDFECYDVNIFDILKIPRNEIHFPSQSKKISDEIKFLYDYSKSELANDVQIDYLLLGIFIHLSNYLHHRTIGSNRIYQEDIRNKFEKLRHDIYQNPTDLNVAKIAKEMSFSPSYFNVVYKKFFFVNPLKDLDTARLEMSKRMLLEGEKTIEIVKQIGFTNEEYFYYRFKKHTGKTVKEFIDSNK